MRQLAFLFLLFVVSANAESAESCSFCPPTYCENDSLAEQLKAAKKRAAQVRGLPTRLLVLFDQLGNCQACIEFAPDWPHIVVEFNGDALSDYYGREIESYTTSRAWSAAGEYQARQDMREGLVSQFHITLGSEPCHCCSATNVEEYRSWQKGNSYKTLLNDPQWNSTLRTYGTTTQSITTIDQAQELPNDLSDIPPNLRQQEPVPGRLSDFQTVAPSRVVQVLCQDCQPRADRYNEIGREINKVNDTLASVQRDLSYEQEMADYSRAMVDSLNAAAATPTVINQQDAHLARMEQAFANIKSLEARLTDLKAKRESLRSDQGTVMVELRECEASQCLPKEEATSIEFPTLAVIVPPSNEPPTQTEPAKINWPDEEGSIGNAPTVELPPLEVFWLGDLLFSHPTDVECPAEAGEVYLVSNNGNPLEVSEVKESSKIDEFLDHTVSGNNTDSPIISGEYNCGSKRSRTLKGEVSTTVTDTVTGESTEITLPVTGRVTKLPKERSDPNAEFIVARNGYVEGPTWKPIQTKCLACSEIVQQYNETMDRIFATRSNIAFYRNWLEKIRTPGTGNWNADDVRGLARWVEIIDGYEQQLENAKASLLEFEQQASYLQSVIRDCERQQCTKKEYTKISPIEVVGIKKGEFFKPDVTSILDEYGFNWGGPYTTDCLPCAPIVKQLNAIPGWLTRMHHKLNWSERIIENEDARIMAHGTANHIADKRAKKMEALKKLIVEQKREMTALKELMLKLQADLALCLKKYCGTDSNGDPILAMPSAIINGNAVLIDNYSQCEIEPPTDPIIVGPNNEVGSSADFKEKAKEKVVGAAVGALADLVGLKSGGSKGDQGPTTYKDPIRNRDKTKVTSKKPSREIRVGAGFTDQGLLVSSEIRKTPGKGTFHSIVLQNERGWQLWPLNLYMYEIWGSWKLSVSWTRDTFVDGELVNHEEGAWSESWQELIAQGEYVNYVEVQQAPLWEQLGFNTATSGAKSLGTLFPVSPAMLKNEPLDLYIHVTDPDENPVVTQPYHFKLSVNEKGEIVTEHIDTDTTTTPTACKDRGFPLVSPPAGMGVVTGNGVSRNDDSGFVFTPTLSDTPIGPIEFDVDGNTITVEPSEGIKEPSASPQAPAAVNQKEPTTPASSAEDAPTTITRDLSDDSEMDEEKLKEILNDPSKFGRKLTPDEIAKLKTKPTEWDTDGDGIQNEADTMPNIPSDAFIAGNTIGRVLNPAGQAVRIYGDNGEGTLENSGGVSIEVDNDEDGGNPTVEILGVELELDPGTILEASFG